MKTKLKLSRLIALILLGVLLSVQCAVNPVTGKKELMFFSEASEIELGKEVDAGLKEEYGIYYDPDLNKYIAEIGRKMAPLTHRPNLVYHFAVLDTEVENAFAAPGGYIYITRGLLAMVNSEAELAAVLGHELGHVNARHSVRTLSRNILFTVGLAVASELSEDIRDIAPIAYLATQLLFLKYSRSDEYQADSLGLEYATKASYQASEMIDFFNSLQRLTKDSGGPHLPNFLSTHPLTPRRITRIGEILNTPEYKAWMPGTSLQIKRNPYLQKIDGLVFGHNPRQGYVQGNVFYHPDMGFSFTFPNGWKVQNTPKKVNIGSTDGNVLLMLSAESITKNLDAQVAEQLTAVPNVQEISSSHDPVNGLEAYHKLVQVQTADEGTGKQKIIKVRLAGIKKGNLVYSFFAASETSFYGTYSRDIERTINSFTGLKVASQKDVAPQKVDVERVQTPQTLQQYLTLQGISRKSWDRIALINGLDLMSTLEIDQLIKIIR